MVSGAILTHRCLRIVLAEMVVLPLQPHSIYFGKSTNWTRFAPYCPCRYLSSLLYLVVPEAAHCLRYMLEIAVWGKQLLSSSLYCRKQEVGADSPCWSMMSSDIVVFHLCCLDPLRFTPPPHPTINVSCRHTARIYTNLCVICIYFPQMLFVSEFVDVCNLSLIYQNLYC